MLSSRIYRIFGQYYNCLINNFCDRGYEDTWIKISEEKSRDLYIPKMTISNAKEIKKLLNYGRNDNADYIWFGQPNLLEYRHPSISAVLFRSFRYNGGYNSILFSSPLVLRSNFNGTHFNLRGFCFHGFYFVSPH